jgi:hypothetical protein
MFLPPSNLGRVRYVPRTIVLDAFIMVKNRPASNGKSGICFSNLAIILVTDCDTGTDFALQKCAKIKCFREESQLLIFSRKWEMPCTIWSNIDQIQPEFLASSLGKYRIKEQKMIENCFNFEKRKYEQAAHREKQVRYIPVTGGRRPESGSGRIGFSAKSFKKFLAFPPKPCYNTFCGSWDAPHESGSVRAKEVKSK